MFSVTKQIHVSYGHRIATHGSKCRSPHGHTGIIAATLSASRLIAQGPQADMVVDFANVKDAMMTIVHDSIDHGFIIAVNDTEGLRMFHDAASKQSFEQWLDQIQEDVDGQGYSQPKGALGEFKLYVMQYAPTAERLAEHFFHRLKKSVAEIGEGGAQLVNIRFTESPTSYADYPATLKE